MYIHINVALFAKYNLPTSPRIILIRLCQLLSAGIVTNTVTMILGLLWIWDYGNLLKNQQDEMVSTSRGVLSGDKEIDKFSGYSKFLEGSSTY